MSQFFNLEVIDIKQETQDTVSVGFSVPKELRPTFNFVAGQYLTLRFEINGKDERRSYSLCSSPSEQLLRVGVKEVSGGLVSTHINQKLKVGDIIEVMPPQGNFILNTNQSHAKNYVAFAAGSGITPILSIAQTIKEEEPQSSIHIFYGNKDVNNTIFKDDLEVLSKYNVTTSFIYSREVSDDDLTNGRIDIEKTKALINKYELKTADVFYLCGPEDMIMNATKGLEELGIGSEKIKFELFTTPVNMESTPQKEEENAFEGDAEVTVIYDDEEFHFTLNTKGGSILETALEEGIDVPFSCKGAVCCTCKAKVIEGSASMEANYALTDEEVEQGYILTCNSHPTAKKVVVNYDEF